MHSVYPQDFVLANGSDRPDTTKNEKSQESTPLSVEAISALVAPICPANCGDYPPANFPVCPDLSSQHGPALQ